MDATLRFAQDSPFPDDKVAPLVKNFLQIKKWLRDLISNELAGISTAKAENRVDDEVVVDDSFKLDDENPKV